MNFGPSKKVGTGNQYLKEKHVNLHEPQTLNKLSNIEDELKKVLFIEEYLFFFPC